MMLVSNLSNTVRRIGLLISTVLITGIPLTGAAAQSTGSVRARSRCADCDDARWDRHDRLLMKLDSLRREFERERLSYKERDAISDEMRRTFSALQETMEPHIPGVVAQQRAPRAPSGYLGISFDGPYVPSVERRGELVVRFLDYPRVALVEPGSPAEYAGVATGDTLIAFNGQDVRDRELSLTRLLVPNRRISMRVTRDGETRDFRVTVAEAPQYILMRKMLSSPVAPLPAVAPASPADPAVPTQGAVSVEVHGDELPRRARWPGVAGAAGPGTIWIYNEGIGGAHVETLTSGLARAVGVRSGVLVIRSRPGTPAYQSGLRDGDVILRVAGRGVASVRELREALMGGEDRESVKLRIRREGRERDLTLRW